MVGEYRFGWTGQDMRATGRTTRQMGEVGLSMLMAMFTRANGRMIKLMVKESTPIQMALAMKEIGKKISSTAMALRDGPMVLAIKDSMLRGRNMGRVNLSGQTGVLSAETFMTTTLRVEVSMNGPMEEFSMENGKITRCRGMEHLLGLMGENMSDSTMMI
jgi:hypothetical protein